MSDDTISADRRKQLEEARAAVERAGGNISQAAKDLDLPRKTVSDRYNQAVLRNISGELEESGEKLNRTETKNSITIEYLGTKIATPDELVEFCEIDTSVWEIDRVTTKSGELAGKVNQGQEIVEIANAKGETSQALRWRGEKLWKTPLRWIGVTLRRKQDQRRAMEELLKMIECGRCIHVPRQKLKKGKKKKRYILELAVMDPHLGLECFVPQADQVWDLDLCESFYLFALDDLIKQARFIAPEIEELHWIFGNDFNHADTVFHTTTAGTPQPENVSQHQSILRGERLAIHAGDKLLDVAPVKAYQIPGNHDRWTSFMMGRILNAYYHANDNFEIDCSPSPFKKLRYGATLIGLEHGHSIAPIRMAALMANEWRFDFAETHYHEWHCGDQHRKGSSKPCAFEEQGVSIEFLPGLVAPNEWHRLKSFNFQKRAATAFLIDYDCGPVAKLTSNISKYTGRWLGTGYDEWLKKQRINRDQ